MSEMIKLTQALNEVAVEGIFQELDITEGKTKPGRDGREKEYIRGTVTIAVEQQVGKETELEEIPISFFATKFKNAGGSNPAYENINALRALKRRSTDGEDADVIRLSSFGNIVENSFVSKNSGQLVSFWNINGSFFSKVIGASNHKAIFKVKIVLRSIEDETNADGPTGRTKIKGVIVQYNNRADLVEFVVEDKQASNHIFKRFNEGDTVIVGGYVRVTITSVQTHQGDGEAMIGTEPDFSSVSSVRRRELVITSVSPNPLDGAEAYDLDVIKDILNARKDRQDAMLASAASAAASTVKTRGW